VLNPSPPIRSGSRADYARLTRHALVDLARSLGDQCAAIVAAGAETPAEWRAVAGNFRSITDERRHHDARAARLAAEAMGREDPIAAALALARLNDEELYAWHCRVSADFEAARVTASVAASAQVGA
jgi:hypothetical protein